MKRVSILLLLLFVPFLSFAQQHLALPLESPLYSILEYGEASGDLPLLPYARPYTRSAVSRYLDDMGKSGSLTARESAYLDSIRENASKKYAGLLYGNAQAEGNLGSVKAGVDTRHNFRIGLSPTFSWHMNNQIRAYLSGDIGSKLSYYAAFSFNYDKIVPDIHFNSSITAGVLTPAWDSASFLPYEFTKQWEGFHIGFSDPRYSKEGMEDTPYFGFVLEDQLAAEFFDGNLLLRSGRFRRNWGVGDGSLVLADTARPFEGLEVKADIAHWFRLSWLVGSLGDADIENVLNRSASTTLSAQRNLTIQTLDFTPFPWMTFGASGNGIWGKRFELGYLSPLMYPVIYQNTQGDMDNMAQEVHFAFRIPYAGKLYFVFFADEMEFTDPADFFARPRNMVAYQAGLKTPVPFLPFGLLTFQYTKVEPFTYAHYPETGYAQYDVPVDMSYTNDGENLGFHAPPNSDEILVRLSAYPLWNLHVSLRYSLLRHGTNEYDAADPYRIYGDLFNHLIYSALDDYPDKDFLSDGVYDWNNIIALKVGWTLPTFPLTIEGEYGFYHVRWDANATGVTVPDPIVGHIISVTFHVFK